MITKRNSEMDFIRTGERRMAVFSDCQLYRFTLEIMWDLELPSLQAIGLNPSTADELGDDRTVAKLKRLAARWGYGSLIMTNLFAFRATEPKDMKRSPSPFGEGNTDVVIEIAKDASEVLCCWGNDGAHMDRAAIVLGALKKSPSVSKLRYLRMTKLGHPEHPLYLPESLPLIPLP